MQNLDDGHPSLEVFNWWTLRTQPALAQPGPRRKLRSSRTLALEGTSAGGIEEQAGGDWPLSTGGHIWRWSTGHSAVVAKSGALEEESTAGATGH